MPEYTHNLKQSKLDLIDRALKKYKIKSIVDLGACWGVHGGYTFHAMDNAKIDKAFIVDGHITEPTEQRATGYPQLKLISGALGDSQIAKEIGKVDAIIMYDIILHQVKPDWDEFLEMWGRRAKHLIIYNQNWTLDDEPVRFIDRGLDWYAKNVPNTGEEGVRKWFAKHDDMSPEPGTKMRDVHYFWQWGIPLKSLTAKLESIGFKIDEATTDSLWHSDYRHVTNDAILASKRK
jgi:hypothetical protein